MYINSISEGLHYSNFKSLVSMKKVLLQDVLPQNVLHYKTSFLQNILPHKVLPQNILPQNIHGDKTFMDTKRPWIQNVLLYKTSAPKNGLYYKTSFTTKCLPAQQIYENIVQAIKNISNTDQQQHVTKEYKKSL